MQQEWLSVEDLAHELQKPVTTIYVWRYKGNAPEAYRFGKTLRFKRSDVDRWLEQHRVGGDTAVEPRNETLDSTGSAVLTTKTKAVVADRGSRDSRKPCRVVRRRDSGLKRKDPGRLTGALSEVIPLRRRRPRAA